MGRTQACGQPGSGVQVAIDGRGGTAYEGERGHARHAQCAEGGRASDSPIPAPTRCPPLRPPWPCRAQLLHAVAKLKLREGAAATDGAGSHSGQAAAQGEAGVLPRGAVAALVRGLDVALVAEGKAQVKRVVGGRLGGAGEAATEAATFRARNAGRG